MNPLVSVLVPVYGVEKYIERCAVCLLEQTYDNLEIIFVNDCTKDNSINLLEKTLTLYPNRKSQVRIVNHEHNKGLGAARNTAVAAANGEFVLHVDSDDYIEKDAVELCVAKQLETGADIVSFGNVREYTDKAHIVMPEDITDAKEFCLSFIARNQHHNIWGRLIRKSLYTDNGIQVVEGVNMGEDYQVLPKLAYYASSVASLNKALYHYNLMNVSSYVHTFSVKNINEGSASLQVIDDFFRDKGEAFCDALNTAKIKIYTRWLINILKADLGKDFYESIHNRVNEVPSRYYSYISAPYRVIAKLKNYRLAKLYMSIIRLFKR